MDGVTGAKLVPILQCDMKVVEKTLAINTFGPLKLCKAFVPLMLKQKYGRIVNMSSGMGALHDMYGKWFAYRISKAGINVITRVLAHELKNENILVNSMCPGFVKTDMTGGKNSKATTTPVQAAVTALWLATLPDNGPSGGFWRRKKAIKF